MGGYYKCFQELCIYGCSILILSLVWYIPTVLQEYDSFLNHWDLWITEQCSMLTLHDQTNHTAVMYLTEHTHTDLQYDRSSRGAPTLLHLDLNRTFASTHSTFMSISCFPGIWCSNPLGLLFPICRSAQRNMQFNRLPCWAVADEGISLNHTQTKHKCACTARRVD